MDLLNTVSHMDIFDLCDCLQDESIDMILCDLPYGITACEWDTVIPFEPMWECFKRVIKPRGAIVLTASGKFTYKLVMSNFDMFKYEWVWDKKIHASFGIAKFQPLRIHEFVLIFSDASTCYYPQKTDGVINHSSKTTRRFDSGVGVTGMTKRTNPYSTKKYPTSVITMPKFAPQLGYHPTQKPVALFEYLIRTYTQAGEVVFDPCVGSGTTAIAARNTGRNFICGDSSEEYVDVARERLALPYTMPMFEDVVAEESPVQAVMELIS